MLKVIEKNILTITEGILCHQTNTRGVMGSGIALQIKNKYPQVYEDYKRVCSSVTDSKDLLGKCLCVPIKVNKLYVANMFGQDTYGREKKCYTDYAAVSLAFQELSVLNIRMKQQVFVPYLMGCGLAGGNWGRYSEIIEAYFPDAIVCKLPGVK